MTMIQWSKAALNLSAIPDGIAGLSWIRLAAFVYIIKTLIVKKCIVKLSSGFLISWVLKCRLVLVVKFTLKNMIYPRLSQVL
jgi:hypothetical protein